MPATANSRGLADPFDPIESIAHSAKLLSDLRRELGNLGLAAAPTMPDPGGFAIGLPAGVACRGRRMRMSGL